jgi:hypothetical protein
MTLGTVPNTLITRCAWCDRHEAGGRWLRKEEVAAFLRDDGSPVFDVVLEIVQHPGPGA